MDQTAVQQEAGDPAIARLGNLEVNFDTYHVFIAERPVVLSYQEFELLRAFVSNIDHIISADVLTRALWQATGHTYVRRLNVVVHRLRAKLLNSRPYQIESVRGRGYGLLTMR